MVVDYNPASGGSGCKRELFSWSSPGACFFSAHKIKQKKYRIRDVYPLHPELKKTYEEDKKKKSSNQNQ